jgi:hypothetical protein
VKQDAKTPRARAEQAWEAHSMLLLIEVRIPTLRNNPFWTVLRQDAFERFALELGEIT